MLTEWQTANAPDDRQRINRARQVAEDLFKPTEQIAEAGSPAAPPNGGVSAELPARRQPRIFNLPPRMPPGAEAELPAEPKPTQRKPVAKRPTGAVPPSQIGRVRVLTSYGMTPAQVADLYDVTVAEIERIISAPADSGKFR